MSKYPATLAQDLLKTEKNGITLANELQTAIASTIDLFCEDPDLAVFAMADDLLPAVLEKFAGLDFNTYEIEPMVNPSPAHTPTDSLTFLDREAVGLLEAADEEIHGVFTEEACETEDLPEHVQDAVSMIQTAIKLIRMEAGLHGARRVTTYSTGSPTSEVRQELGFEPQDDGTTRLVMHDLHYGLYPDGRHNHPAFR